METLRAQGLTKRFGPRMVLAGLDLALEAGEVVTVVGANGVGKSTLLRCCAGLLLPCGGTLRVGALGPAAARRRGWIGLAAGGDHSFDRRLPLDANLVFHARLAGVPRRARRRRILELAELLGFRDHLEVPAERCSSGVRARAALARALLPRPRLLLLDEPLRSVDAESRGPLARQLREHGDGAACLWVSHDPAEVARVGDRVLCLEDGRLRPAPRLVRAA